MTCDLLFVWHPNHDGLLTPLWRPFEARLAEIDAKPEGERALRRRLYQLVRGALPTPVVLAGQVWAEARRALEVAWHGLDVARWPRWTRRASNEAERAWNEAERAWNEAERAWNAALADHAEEVAALHAQECPDCPWDERTIFGPSQQDGGTPSRLSADR